VRVQPYAPLCTTMRHTAPHCTTVHYSATHSIIALHCNARDERHHNDVRQAPTRACAPGNTRCTALQHTLHCTATHTALHCNTHCTATHLHQHTSTHCTTLQHSATHCYTLQHTAALCNTHDALFALVKDNAKHEFCVSGRRRCSTFQ